MYVCIHACVCVCVCVCVYYAEFRDAFRLTKLAGIKKKSGGEKRASRWRGAADGRAGVMPLRPHSSSRKAVCTSCLRPHTLAADGHAGVMPLIRLGLIA